MIVSAKTGFGINVADRHPLCDISGAERKLRFDDIAVHGLACSFLKLSQDMPPADIKFPLQPCQRDFFRNVLFDVEHKRI